MKHELRDAVEAASLYRSLGWYPIPLRPGTKECRDKDWRERVYSAEEFAPEENVGIRLVNAADVRSKKLVSVDLDSEETVRLAHRFLPATSAAWGRDSKPISQMLYLSPIEKIVAYKDVGTGKTIAELRVDHQSMAPPSLHPSGERLSWLPSDSLDAPEVEPQALVRAVRLLCTCALAARYYNPPGNRHEWCLALAGTLRNLGLSEEEAVAIIDAAAEMVGDEKRQDRVTEVSSTYARADDDIFTGAPRLQDVTGGDVGRNLIESLKKIWGERSSFMTDERGRKILANSQENVRRAIEEMGVVLSLNVFSGKMYLKRGEVERQYDGGVADRLWLDIDARFHFRPTRDFFDVVVRDQARRTLRHPVLEYLSDLKWDEKPRLDTWLIDLGKAKDTLYNRAVGAIVLIAAVRRVRNPGCKFDEILVLESFQGQNKSTMLRSLCHDEDWFSDDLPLGVDTKQVIERTLGKWIIEAQELVNIRKMQAEQLKSFLSRQVDGPVRMAYDRESTERPRQFIIVGTTNSVSYLRDATGNRRFWPVQTPIFDIKKTREIRDQLWAEAATRESRGESIRLASSLYGDAEKEQENRRTEDPWEAVLAGMIASLEGTDKQRIDPDDIWRALGLGTERRDEKAAERVSTLMQRHGFRRMIMKKEGRALRGWGRDLVGGIWRPGGWE